MSFNRGVVSETIKTVVIMSHVNHRRILFPYICLCLACVIALTRRHWKIFGFCVVEKFPLASEYILVLIIFHRMKIIIIFFSTGAPVYLSFPHFYKADPKLLDAIDGLKPVPELHETFFKIQPVIIY